MVVEKKTTQQDNMKGGKEKMEEKINGDLFTDTCKYCGKKFTPTQYPEQLRQWKETHEKHCKLNPSNKEE